MIIEAAADGSALGNPGPAGWAWYVDQGCWASGGWPRGTNNMGELMAVLDLLRQTAGSGAELVVYCDSMYVINTVTQWMAGWKRRGWRKKDGKPVMNVELVKALDEAMVGREVTFEWVKGHAGHPLNEEADRLAVAASTAFRERREPDAGPGFPRTDGPSAPAPLPDLASGQVVPEEDLFSTSPSDEHEVVGLERALLGDAVRSDPDAVAALLDASWSEIGASGRSWTREAILAAIAPLAAPVRLEVRSIEMLAPDVVLLVWRAVTDEHANLRSSIWVRRGGRWRQRFAQGTPEHGVRP